ncbi:DNA-directed RNA polymerase I subunit RPA14 NDAI_0J00900 [Naumovozyma dairenensis CBS 421]|uniref:DNA-directed RNA polymerase I subunit RPA14 n=1 Tax=Naumovozyma dairenensis (strain ATCC 10597 / BCRC 20456 / CBS 421 / NBRC 0211 / NRRL Y-12639) TaxID=1071378 RepID=G0WGQ4_NAUDC|nr:hypothetical protein NDAI_0J00900 [Naumovozyma dairenensis CBS 421]CCD26982.1 hypothetical protein NDAI_0J00900 [Naumovozyma dairenensis CBS 421]
MFKGNRRGNFNTATPLNTPIVIHTTDQPKHVSKEEVLSFLNNFITEKESLIQNNALPLGDAAVTTTSTDGIASGDAMISIDTTLSSSLSQLKRLQRDFKGLPPSNLIENTTTPSLQEESTTTTTTKHTSVTKSATGGTKKTFGDDDEESDKVDDEESDKVDDEE